MSDIDYSEKDFEKYIVNLLVAKSGYIQGNNNDYNPQKALLPQTFISFIKETQPDNWTCLCDKFDSEKETEEKLIEELLTSRKNQGTLDLFRKGFVFRSIAPLCSATSGFPALTQGKVMQVKLFLKRHPKCATIKRYDSKFYHRQSDYI